MSQLETPEAMAERLVGSGESATAITMRGILAEALRERDAAILARLDEITGAATLGEALDKLNALRAELRGQP